MYKTISALVLGSAALFTTSASAWWDEGHMMVAAVAYPLLDREVKAKVDALIAMNPDYPIWIAGVSEEDRAYAAFVHAATWADDIKKPEHGYTNDGESPYVPGAMLNIGYSDLLTHRYWHYKDIEFSTDGSDVPPTPFVNGETIIKNFRDTLASQASPFIKSYDLIWLIHLIGDAHQPLHAAERVTKDVRGDQGGNLIKVKTPSGEQMKLHGYWDSLLGETATPAQVIEAIKDLPVPDGARTAVSDPADWYQESFGLAKQYVYTSAIGNGAGPYDLSTDYDAAAHQLAKMQAAVAGARLANLLNAALK